MHGGIAITAEHDIQLYFKQRTGSGHLFRPADRVPAPAESVALAAPQRFC